MSSGLLLHPLLPMRLSALVQLVHSHLAQDAFLQLEIVTLALANLDKESDRICVSERLY